MREFTGEDRSPAGPQRLKPYRYPIWVILCATAVIGVGGYASISLPAYLTTARIFAQAKTLERQGNHTASEPLFRQVLARSPNSRSARLALAKALFADGGDVNGIEAMRLLEGIKLSKSEWEELQPYMPEKYRQLFTEEKN